MGAMYVQVPIEERKVHQTPWLELQLGVSLLVCMLGTERGSSGRAVHALTTEGLHQPQPTPGALSPLWSLEILLAREGKCQIPCWQLKATQLGLLWSMLSLTRGSSTQSLSEELLILCFC